VGADSLLLFSYPLTFSRLDSLMFSMKESFFGLVVLQLIDVTMNQVILFTYFVSL
jgi:hypothetical protein